MAALVLLIPAIATGQVMLNVSICTPTVSINELPTGSTTCVNLAPYCHHHLHGEYITQRCPEACSWCDEINNPTQVHLRLGVDSTPAQDSDVDKSAMTYTIAVGIAGAIGVLLLISMAYAGYSKMKKKKFASDNPVSDSADLAAMWDDETWDVQVGAMQPEIVLKRSNDTIEVDVAQTAAMLNEHGIGPAIMREMLSLQNRAAGIKSASPMFSYENKMGLSSEARSPSGGQLSPLSAHLAAKAEARGTVAHMTLVSPRPDNKAGGAGTNQDSTYTFYTGPAAPIHPASPSFGGADGHRAQPQPDTGGKMDKVDITTPATGVEVELGELYSMVGADAWRRSAPVRTAMERITAGEIDMRFGQIMDGTYPGPDRDGSSENSSRSSSLGSVEAVDYIESDSEDDYEDIVDGTPLAAPRSKLGDRLASNESAQSALSFTLEVPDANRGLALDQRKDSAFCSEHDWESPSADTKAQQEQAMNRTIATATAQAVGQLEAMKVQSERQIQALAEKARQSDQQIQKLTKRTKSAKAEIALLEEQRRNAEDEKKELRKHKQISTAELRKFKEIIKTMQLQDGTLNNSLRMAQMQLGDLEAENAEIKKMLKSSAIELAAANRDASRFKADLATLTADKSASDQLYRQNLAVMRSELTELQKHHKTLSSLAKNEYPKVLFGLKVATKTLVGAHETAIEDATKDLMKRYRYETRERKLLYNHIQEMRGNIRVFCRVRSDSRTTCVLRFPDKAAMGTPTELVCPNPNDPTLSKRFEFDRVFSPTDDQATVFDDTEPVITSTVDGYNVSIVAYGQTGSGKTYTMMGTEDNPGVNRRAIRELLKVCNDRTNVNYAITVSLLEIYNDSIIDLLTEDAVDTQDCKLRIDPATKLGFVSNLKWRGIKTIDDVVNALVDGEKNRSVACTKMNSASSRSHLVLTLEVTGIDAVTEEKTVGKLRMVDLAGSERNSKSGATGKQLVEANAINTSLSALGQVFIGLRAGDKHIPFRNSKLTHLLQDSLGGQSKTCFFVNISPSESNLQETMSTLQFGSSIRKVLLKKNPAATPDGSPALVKKIRREGASNSALGCRDGAGLTMSPLPSPKLGRPPLRGSDPLGACGPRRTT